MAIDVTTVDEALSTTRSVRLRLDLERPVDPQIILDCIDVAEQAPTGGNQSSRRWIVVTDPALKARLAELYLASAGHWMIDTRDRLAGTGHPQERVMRSAAHLAEHLAEVPVLCIPTIGSRYGERTTFQQASKWGSILPAVWSFMLALRSRGLGSAWTTIHLYREREVADLLGIPAEDHTQAGLFPIAYTKGLDFSPADRSRSADRVGWNRFPSR